MQDPRVPLLRDGLAIAGDTSDTTYDKTVAELVKKFKDSHHLAASGLADRRDRRRHQRTEA